MYETALKLLKEIHFLGCIGYMVGGYPRDKYLGKISSDIDICTSMQPQEIKKHFHVIKNYEKLGSFVIQYKEYLFQITTFRREGEYSDYRHPNQVEFVETLKEDMERRDFIMNTLCIDKNGEYVDVLGAMDDMDKKKIRSVGNPLKKITEDPLRMVRAIRFMVQLDFTLEEDLKRTIEQHLDLLSKVPKVKIAEEIGKVFSKEKQELFRIILKI